MKKIVLFFAIILELQFVLFANPVDGTPFTLISELVFTNSDWTMELSFWPAGYDTTVIDSIKIKVSGIESRLNIHPANGTNIYVITNDSLSIPLTINQDGDQIDVYTYSHINTTNLLRKRSLIFGDYPGAVVGKPIDGYSIFLCNGIYFLTKKPSLGIQNNDNGRSAVLTGHIYDSQNRIVTKLKPDYYFIIESKINFNEDSTYSTKVFRKFTNQTISYIDVYMYMFDTWVDSNKIVPFELNNIHPDTTVVKDIHLIKDDYIITSVKNEIIPRNYKITLINYPNPFNLSTNFYVKLPDNLKGKPGIVKIYNAAGQLIKNIFYKNGFSVSWYAVNKYGMPLPSGIYYYQLSIENKILKTGKMILLK